MSRLSTHWLSRLIAAAALSLPVLAQAAAYTFPTTMPAGCSGSGGSYTCTALTLGYGDTVAIAGTKPATLTINGNFDASNALINQAGVTADLNIVVNGTLTFGYQAKIKGNVTATAVNDAGGGGVVLTGNLTATGGNVSLGYQTAVSGNLSTSGSGTLLTAVW
ncbi:MAG: hypothetical protein EOP35_01050 [Rubrivivax sp.]|nr:MAG: hypothetical protein EOP35_01050 [Rubrivivax sp.]